MRHRILLVLGAMALIVSSSASGETESIHEEIPWKGEKLVEVEIDFGAGDLTLSAGSGDLLLDADIETPEDAPRPKILYQVQDGVGKLRLKSEKRERHHWRWPRRSRWELRFSDKVPLTFEINMGANKGRLNFTDLRVRNLAINIGASSTEILFSKPNPEILERIEINAGAARVRAKGLGNANFERLTFEGGVGFYTLDFRGKMNREADVDISIGVAQLTMLIPEKVGTRIKKETPLSAFWADGFEKENGYYVNDSFGRTKGTLTITVEGGLGSINVETVEGF